ncbi:MAG: penicillin-binding protein 2 [Rhodospirillales bacterium]|nr:penicillin-binding protein 2 [Rhodospirillales bacterium]
MHRDTDRHKLFSRRVAVLGGGKLLLMSALVGRMYYLQVVESERYKTLADDNRINYRLLAPPRGHIIDRFGRSMAINQENHQVVLSFEGAKATDIRATLETLTAMIPLSDGDKRRVLREMRRRRSFVAITLKENLNWEEVARIEVNAPDLPGVAIDVGQTRFYPHGPEVAHVLGYVAAVSEKEIDGDPLLELPGFRIGKSGIEKIHDLALRGAGGASQVEVDAIGRVMRELERREGQAGAEVSLTIDLELQKMVTRRLKDHSGAVVVMDAHNGDVLSMVSSPSFDPNAFNTGLSVQNWQTLISNPRAPLTNKAIAGQYPPGSTFKMVVALAALERGIITPATQFFCSGSVELGDAEFHCWKKHGHSTVDLMKGISQSCDVYFYEIARRVGIDRIAAMARRLGFGGRLGLDLPGEQTGLIPTKRWKRKAVGSSWQQGETLIAGIGQGYVLATPLQMAVMTARLVNGGYAVVPHLTRSVSTLTETSTMVQEEIASLGIARRHLKAVSDAMADVVNGPMGTARKSQIQRSGFEMGGKTGTSQVRRITKAERDTGVRKNEELPWEQRDHSLFVGYAPLNAPRYVVAVVIEHGGGGSKTAAPIARDILYEAQVRNAARPGVKPRVAGYGSEPA